MQKSEYLGDVLSRDVRFLYRSSLMSVGDLDVGDVVDGKFRLVALLGEGAMGRVFEAQHLFMNRRVAVKLLNRDAMRASGAFQRFRQEALAASRIEHRNIVAVLDFGVDRDTDQPYVVQEFLAGMTLQSYLETAPGGRLSVREAIDIITPIMSGLEAAHAQGIIHRDIKPANIFLARDGSGRFDPKIIDFGIAKALTPLLQDAARTRDGQPVGTPAYMSREQAEGIVEADERTDVWAVGVVLFEMLSGRRPYEAPNTNLILVQVLTRDPPTLASVAPDVDVRICAVVDRALRPDREQRLASMNTFLHALVEDTGLRDDEVREFRSSLALTARSAPPIIVRSVSLNPPPPSTPPPAPSTGATLAPTTSDNDDLAPVLLHTRRWAVVVPLLGVVLLFFIAYTSTTNHAPPARAAASQPHSALPPTPSDASATSFADDAAEPDTRPPSVVRARVADAAPPPVRSSHRVPHPGRPQRVILSLDVFTIEDDP